MLAALRREITIMIAFPLLLWWVVRVSFDGALIGPGSACLLITRLLAVNT